MYKNLPLPIDRKDFFDETGCENDEWILRVCAVPTVVLPFGTSDF